MLYRDFGKTGFKVSAIGLGTWNIGGQWGEIDDATAWTTVRRALDCGVTLFDAAESYGFPYGTSEERLGRVLAGDRHRVRIVTKVGNWGKREDTPVPKNNPHLLRLCAHACLYRLRTDWIDTLLCHEGNIEDPSVYLEAFEDLKRTGHILSYGISTDSLDVLRRFNADGGCSVVQVNYSLLNRAPEEEFLPYCEANGIAVLVRGPLAMGLLSGRYSAQTRFEDSVRANWHRDPAKEKQLRERLAAVYRLREVVEPGADMIRAALRYTISHTSCPVAIPGAKSPAQAELNASAGERLLDEAERGRLLAALTDR